MAKIVLFQGDSITDCNRNREKPMSKGIGYAGKVASFLGAHEPYQYTFYNRGISGNRVVDLYARIRSDMINLKPDYMSILVGVNDVWHEYKRQNGVDAEKYEMVYDLILTELKRELPELKIMIMEPFVVQGIETKNTEEHPNRWEYFRSEVELRAAAARRLAEKHGLPFIPLQKMFDDLCKDAPEDYWTADGVHPSIAGHEMIKDEWLKAFEKNK